MKIELDINLKENNLMRVKNVKKAFECLDKLYGKIWTECRYDPYNEETEKYANSLLPLIQEASEILGFRE